MIDVLLVEDDRNLRAAVRQAIDAPDTGMRVVADFDRGGDALRFLKGAQTVHCALVDLGLPDLPGAEVLSELRARRPDCVALTFTIFDDDDHLFPALQAGAHGYLLKDAPPSELLESIREAVAGGAPMAPAVARRVVRRFWAAPAPQQEPLTPRERELLTLLCHGASYDNAAATMQVSLSTVQAHVRSTYRKLSVNSKAEAVSAAVRLRLFIP